MSRLFVWKGNTKTARFEGANFKTGPNHKTLGHRSYVMATSQITDSRGTVKLFSCFLLAIIL